MDVHGILFDCRDTSVEEMCICIRMLERGRRESIFVAWLDVESVEFDS